MLFAPVLDYRVFCIMEIGCWHWSGAGDGPAVAARAENAGRGRGVPGAHATGYIPGWK